MFCNDAVKAYGITAKEFGENVQDQSSKGFEVPYRIHATDDPWESPDDMIERLIQDHDVILETKRLPEMPLEEHLLTKFSTTPRSDTK